MAVETVTEAIVERLADANVKYIFGVPGGECNLDFIAAAEKLGVKFILTRTETSAVMMACAASEITGTTGVAMTTRGPGLAAATNGTAYADLDRVPLLLIADGYEDDQGYISHQRIDQTAILAPLTRASSDLRGADAIDEIERLLEAANSLPPGPVYLEVAGSYIRGKASGLPGHKTPPTPRPLDPAVVAEAKAMLAKAKRPLIMAGLQARSEKATKALRDFVAKTGIPVLTSYKAKGVMSEHEPLGMGLYCGGVAEQSFVREADLILLYGFDTVEGPPSPWRYSNMPMIELTEHAFEYPLFKANVSVVGDITESLGALTASAPKIEWTEAALKDAKNAIWTAARVPAGPGISPEQLVDAAQVAMPSNTRITIDAGAHMLPVLHLWRAGERNQSLISRGLSTMGFALPAAIAASLVDPDRPTLAFTGDGGIMMCLGELGTAIQYGAKPIVVVFNDSSLTLIGAKQARRQLAPAGVDFSHTNFATIASGFGWNAHHITSGNELPGAFEDALASNKPTLIDVEINPDSYAEQILRIRG